MKSTKPAESTARQVQIITEDDQGEPNKAATVVTKLINQDKVEALAW